MLELHHHPLKRSLIAQLVRSPNVSQGSLSPWWLSFPMKDLYFIPVVSIGSTSEMLTVAMGQINCSLNFLFSAPCDAITSESMNPRVLWSLHWRPVFRELATIIRLQKLRPLLITTTSVSLHFPTHHCSRSFFRLLILWVLKDLLIFSCVKSEDSDVRPLNRTTDVEYAHRLWGPHGLESCMASVCDLGLIYGLRMRLT